MNWLQKWWRNGKRVGKLREMLDQERQLRRLALQHSANTTREFQESLRFIFRKARDLGDGRLEIHLEHFREIQNRDVREVFQRSVAHALLTKERIRHGMPMNEVDAMHKERDR